jgi:Zn-dependent protease
VGGVPVFLRPSWFLIAAVITVLFGTNVRAVLDIAPGLEYVVALGFAVILLVSVLVHELAHAAAAAATGTPATHIVLDLWGGHTAFEEESAGPGRSIVVCVVGPAANAAIALGALAALRASGTDGVPGLLLFATATSNVLVAAFNALPGLPLDGGRVLEAVVWRVSGDRNTGTVVAGWTGRVVAVGVAAGTVVTIVSGARGMGQAVWLLLVAGLLWQGAGQAIGSAGWSRRARSARVADLLQPAVAVPSTATVADALAAAAEAGASAVVVLDVYGRPASVLDEREAAAVPAARGDQVGAAAVAHALPEGAVIEAGLGGEELIRRLQARPTSRYAVLGEHQRVVGVLDWEDVARYVQRA